MDYFGIYWYGKTINKQNTRTPMTRDDFVQNIIDEITISGSLQITVKKEEIERIIDNEKRNVFRNWRDTVELRYGIVPVPRLCVGYRGVQGNQGRKQVVRNQ